MLTKIAHHLRWRFDQATLRLRGNALARRWRGRRKTVSAMVRIRDSEEFLLSSVLSILDLVDEVVLFDNLSKDSSPDIIRALVSRFPERVKSFHYPHDCVRVGEEFLSLYAVEPLSPRLGTVYTNWCLERCSHPFVLCWDHDMIALDLFHSRMNDFRTGNDLAWEFGGHNLSADRKHLLTWAAGIELRVLPKSTTKAVWSAGASAGGYDGPSADIGIPRDCVLVTEEPLYAHMKYCMRDPGRIQSPEFRAKIEAGISLGAATPANIERTVSRWLSEAEALDGAKQRDA